jgi:hypothetical protein
MSNSLTANTVVDVGSTKQAALIFDHVIPLDGIEGVSGVGTLLAGTSTDTERAKRIVAQLLPPDIGSDQEVADFTTVAAIGVSAIQAAAGLYDCGETTKEANEYGAKLTAPVGFDKYIAGASVTVDGGLVDAEGEHALQAKRALVSIAGILVPSAKDLSWDAITELRKDATARQRLRRLRVFAANEYAGKSRGYIEDDLSVRAEDYEQVLKSWGIKTALGALSTCLSVQTALQASIVEAMTVLGGLPPGGALISSLVVPFGRFVVELGNVRLAREGAIRQYPLAYITDVKQRTM